MPSEKKSKKSHPKRSQPLFALWKSNPILTITLALLFVGFTAWGFLAWQQKRTIAAEKHSFAVAERDIREISDKLTAAFGQPLSTEFDKSCSQPSYKFYATDISCSVSSSLVYDARNGEYASKVNSIVQSTASYKWGVGTLKVAHNLQDDKFNDLTAVDLKNEPKAYGQAIKEYKSSSNDTTCFVNNTYYATKAPPSESLPIYLDLETLLFVSVRCGGFATHAYYPEE